MAMDGHDRSGAAAPHGGELWHTKQGGSGMANVVLGHYRGYLMLAAKLDCASFFSLPGSAWNVMDAAARWEANSTFLNNAIAQKDKFVFSHHPVLACRGSSFFRELIYLQSRGVPVLPTQDAHVP